jgi:hypothetical protein
MVEFDWAVWELVAFPDQEGLTENTSVLRRDAKRGIRSLSRP